MLGYKAAWTVAFFYVYHAGTLHVPAIATASHRQEAATSSSAALSNKHQLRPSYLVLNQSSWVGCDTADRIVDWYACNIPELSRHLTLGDVHRAENRRPCWLSGLKKANGMAGIQMVRLWFSALVMFFWMCTVHLISSESGQKLTVDAKCHRISYTYCLNLHITTSMPQIRFATR